MEFDKFIESIDIEEGNGWILASLTDEYYVSSWSREALIEIDKEKLLEIRVFNEVVEHKLYRANIDNEFIARSIKDVDYNDYYDEVQYLDIDATKGVKNGFVTTTGGGVYKYPIQGSNKIDNAKVRIRYYLGKYEETGQARIEDWRVVEFLEGK